MSVPNLTSLLKQSQITDHEEVLRAANATLKSSKNDIDAQHVKVVALLKLDRFDDAVRAVETGNEKLKEQAKLEYAYALYKGGKRKEAAAIAQSTTSRGLQHVEAQALYGLEQFVRAADLYRNLGKEVSDDNVADLRVNTLAVNAQLEWNGLGQHVEDKTMSREDFEAHETVYNTACASVARGELGPSEVLLKRARSICENLQDLSEDEKASELLPITVQQIYVLTRLGRLEEADKLSSSLDTSRISDPVTRYLFKVNQTSTKVEGMNPFLLEKQLSMDLDSFKPTPPFTFQQSVINRNQYVFDLGVMKFEGTASATQQKIVKEAAPTSAATINTLSVVNAAAHAKNQTGKEALRYILPLLEKRPNDVGLILTVVQLYTLTNNLNSAIDLLQKFLLRLESKDGNEDVRYAPGLVGSLVSLYISQGRREQARTELGKAASHWKRRSKTDSTPGGIHLLKAAGSALLESQRTEDHVLARSIFEDLHNMDKHDKYAAAGVLAASDDASVTSPEDKSALTTFEKLAAGVNIDELEASGIAQRDVTQQPQPASRKRPATGEDADGQNKLTKKIRKSKMPKEYDPAKTPDPERWLPLRDRSTYRPKGKKGKARQAMLSQGAAVAGDSDGSRPVTPGGEVIKAKVAPGGGGGNNNNKKKKAKSNKK